MTPARFPERNVPETRALCVQGSSLVFRGKHVKQDCSATVEEDTVVSAFYSVGQLCRSGAWKGAVPFSPFLLTCLGKSSNVRCIRTIKSLCFKEHFLSTSSASIHAVLWTRATNRLTFHCWLKSKEISSVWWHTDTAFLVTWKWEIQVSLANKKRMALLLRCVWLAAIIIFL